MNLNKGCIEIYLGKRIELYKSKMNLNKGCIEMIHNFISKQGIALDEP